MIQTLYGGSWNQSSDYPFIVYPTLWFGFNCVAGCRDKIVSGVTVFRW